MSEEIKRVNFFDGQFLKEQEFIDEQHYHLHMRRRIMYALFAKPGVISISGDDLSLNVDPTNSSNKMLVIKAGMALALCKSTMEAKELILADPFTTDLSKVQGIAGKIAYITLNYTEEDSFDPPSEGDVNKPTRKIEKAVVTIGLDSTKISAGNDEGYIILGAVNYDTMKLILDQRQEAKLRTSLVDFAPTIITQPQPATVNENSSVIFSVVATGTPPISYQWKKDGVNITNATNSTFTINSAQASDCGKYSVRASNTQGITDSLEVTLNVITKPSISSQPQNQSVTAGSPVTFTVVAGGQNITYQWQQKLDSGTYKDISGQVSQSYTISSPAINDSGTNYRVHISNSAGSIDSQVATLTVTPALKITTQPSNVTVIEGKTATFTVTATGTGTLTYQWKKDSVPIPNATSASYSIPNETIADNNAKFMVTVKDSTGNSVDSQAATLTVTLALKISTQPSNVTIIEGKTATFTVTATGTGTLTYQWKKKGAIINNANSATYTTPVETIADNNATFIVTITDSTGNSLDSQAATLTVTPALKITTQPTSITILEEATANFKVTASGTGTLTYQWKKNGVVIANATSSSYTTPNEYTDDDKATFKVTVTDSAGNSIDSVAAVLNVTPQTPKIISVIPNATKIGMNITITGQHLYNVDVKFTNLPITSSTLESGPWGNLTYQSQSNDGSTYVANIPAGIPINSPLAVGEMGTLRVVKKVNPTYKADFSVRITT